MGSDLTKRSIDLALASFALIGLAPLMALVAILVLFGSGPPVLFRQARVGLCGRKFAILKFRTMRSTGTGPSVTAAGDERITGVGHFLRKYRLDELPQLWNVLLGDMSFVGPRPEVPEYVAMYPEEARYKVLSVRPGLTDPATLQFIDEQEVLASYADPERAYREVVLPQKLQIYVRYANEHTVANDFWLLIRTVAALFTR